jgi:DNA polymerase I
VKTLIIDCHAICHAVKHTIGDLSYEEQKVGIVFGFLKQLLSLAKRFDTHQFIFAWDSKKSKRRELYPPYKRRAPLPKKDQQFERFAFQQFIELRTKTLPKFGFKNSFISTGLEADDIIAKIVLTYPNEFVIVSGDSDLYQLLSNHVSMFSTKAKKRTTAQSFENEWGISPPSWIKVKQIAGCRSDTVEGIYGVAEKTAVKYLTGTLKESTKAYQNIVNGQEIIARNEALVKLPLEGTITPTLSGDEIFYVANFIELTDRYGFKSFQQVEMLNSWITHFEMK